jgi:transcriptional regulator with GAF, ATPase, and Fis domain
VDTRIIVASNRSLTTLVEQGRFRLDLYYRLNGVDIQVPPLRHRRDDVLELARYFLERHRAFRPMSLSMAAADALLAYDWPGNVRELERVIERAVALAGGPFLDLDDLPPALLGGYTEVLLPALDSKKRCERGEAAMRGSCSSGAGTTSGRRAGSLVSAMPRECWEGSGTGGKRLEMVLVARPTLGARGSR